MDKGEIFTSFNIELAKLPFFLQELIDLLGQEEALKFVSLFGGQCKYIPHNPHRSKLRHELSLDGLEKLAKVMGGVEVEVPMLVHFERQVRNQAIASALKQGISRSVLARKYGLTVRQIANIKRDMMA